MVSLLIAAGLLEPLSAAPAIDSSCGPPDLARPRIGLVLSGGGARGFAHVGVLKVLQEMRVPVDCVAGTSMGAIVGGLYASGMDPRQIEDMVRSLDWQDAFRDRPSRRDLAFRRKLDDRNFLVRFPLGLKHGHILLPRGLVQGQKLQQLLRGMTLPVSDRERFDQLPTPFRAVATNLETGRGVLMDRGDLASAMRASMSAPGVFAPVERDGALLVDGGLAENLPMDVARAMGADVLLVVDVSFQLQNREHLESALAVSNQMIAILVRRDAERQKATLTPKDLLIEPQLGDLASTDFTGVARSIELGEVAARLQSSRLAQLSLGERDYQLYAQARGEREPLAPRIDYVSIDPLSRRYAPTILSAMQPLVGKPLDVHQLGEGLTELYGLDNFESLDYSIVRREQGGAEQTGIEVHARRKSWGPNYIRFGMNLQDDFQGNSSYNAAARFIITEINRLGGEWLTDLQIGENPKAVSEFYQPLTADRRWFLAPAMRVEVRSLPVYDGELRIAEYRIRNAQANLDFGRDLGNWGEIRTGLAAGSGAARVRLGDANLPVQHFQSGGAFLRFSYDRLDNLDFPRQGQTFSIQWDAQRTGLGADLRADRLQADWLAAMPRGRNTLVAWTSFGTTLSQQGTTQLQDLYTLGGFFNLSGRPAQSVFGAHYAIARAIYFRKIGRGGEGLFDFPAYLGVALEAGNAWNRRGDISLHSAHKDAAVFLGLDTFLGPLYLGTGYDEAGTSAFYLFLGRTF
ncbi:MAG: patatin-like phospholipase family protein [Steroidobacteraceae bacterium]